MNQLSDHTLVELKNALVEYGWTSYYFGVIANTDGVTAAAIEAELPAPGIMWCPPGLVIDKYFELCKRACVSTDTFLSALEKGRMPAAHTRCTQIITRVSGGHNPDILVPGFVKTPEMIATCSKCGCVFRYTSKDVYLVDNTAYGDHNSSTKQAIKCKQEGCNSSFRI